MTPVQLSHAVRHSVRDAVRSGELSVPVPESVPLRRPPHGGAHWATGVALRLAGPAGRSPAEVARLLRTRLLRVPGVRSVRIDGPGFLNITLADGADVALLGEILARTPPPALPEDPARDAARWATAAGCAPDGLLVQRAENPLFRVRHAHARTRALARWAPALGVAPAAPAGRGEPEAPAGPEGPARPETPAGPEGPGAPDGVAGAEPAPSPYALPAERRLLGLLGERPPERRPAGWLLAVADAFWDTERARDVLPVGDEKPGAGHRARLALAQAAGLVLAGGLHRLGISAPEHV